VVGTLTLIAALLRLVGLDRPLWYDEIVTLVDFVRQPLIDLLTQPAHANNHPLYSVIAQLSVVSFGEHAWSLRLPAVIAGVASIPATYVLGVEVTSRREAFLGAAFLTVSYHHIWFSQNARGYTAISLWTILATFMLLRALARGDMRWWIGHGLMLAFGLSTHLTMAMVAASHALICVWAIGWQRGERLSSKVWLRPAVSFMVAAVIAALVYAPLAAGLFQDLAETTSGEAPAASSPGWAIWEALRGLRVGLGFWGLLSGAALAAAGTLSYLHRDRLVALLFLMPGALMAGLIVFLKYPARPRFFFFLIGFFALFLVRGAMVVGEAGAALFADDRKDERGRTWGFAVAGLMIVASVISLAHVWDPKQDFGSALEFVESQRDPGEPVATTGPAIFPYLEFYRTGWETVHTRAELDALRRRGRRVWIVYTLPAHVPPEVRTVLEKECPPARVFPGTVGGGDVIVCAAAPLPSPPEPTDSTRGPRSPRHATVSN
jgi:hypothetical protein